MPVKDSSKPKLSKTGSKCLNFTFLVFVTWESGSMSTCLEHFCLFTWKGLSSLELRTQWKKKNKFHSLWPLCLWSFTCHQLSPAGILTSFMKCLVVKRLFSLEQSSAVSHWDQCCCLQSQPTGLFIFWPYLLDAPKLWCFRLESTSFLTLLELRQKQAPLCLDATVYWISSQLVL